MNNNFIRNPFFNSGNNKQYSDGKFSNYAKLGHRTVEEVKEDMNNVKFQNKNVVEHKNEVANKNDFNHSTDFRNRVNNLRNINRD